MKNYFVLIVEVKKKENGLVMNKNQENSNQEENLVATEDLAGIGDLDKMGQEEILEVEETTDLMDQKEILGETIIQMNKMMGIVEIIEVLVKKALTKNLINDFN